MYRTQNVIIPTQKFLPRSKKKHQITFKCDRVWLPALTSSLTRMIDFLMNCLVNVSPRDMNVTTFTSLKPRVETFNQNKMSRLLPKHELSAKLNGPLNVMENEAALEIPSHKSTFNNLAWIIRNSEQSVVVARWHWTQTILGAFPFSNWNGKFSGKWQTRQGFSVLALLLSSAARYFTWRIIHWSFMCLADFVGTRSGFLTRWVMRILRIKGALM